MLRPKDNRCCFCSSVNEDAALESDTRLPIRRAMGGNPPVGDTTVETGEYGGVGREDRDSEGDVGIVGEGNIGNMGIEEVGNIGGNVVSGGGGSDCNAGTDSDAPGCKMTCPGTTLHSGTNSPLPPPCDGRCSSANDPKLCF